MIGFAAMAYFARHGMEAAKRLTPVLLLAAFGGLLLVLVPGFGIEVNGARRWLGAGPIQMQPSELAKLGLVLYAALLISTSPKRTRSLGGVRPLLLIAAGMAALIGLEPDMGTAIVITLTLCALLVVGGVPTRKLALLAGSVIVIGFVFAMLEPYRRARLTAFINPWEDATGSGFQSVQAQIAIGSGGLFGVGIGESVQKLFYLPEAHTDMILAVIGEELGLLGDRLVLSLYGMIAYAGLRTARRARDLYAKLVAAGITSVIVIQATVNFFAVLGVMPLTGVPLPFISYGNSNLVVLLSGMGLLINVAQSGGRARRAPPKLRVVKGDGRPGKQGRQPQTAGGRGARAPATGAGPGMILSYAEGGDRSRRDGRPRRAGDRGRGRAARTRAPR